MDQTHSGEAGDALVRPPHPEKPASYVVHPHRVVAEDLSDILVELGVEHVRIAAHLGEVPTTGVALAVIAAGAKDLADLPHVGAWAETGVPVVILDARADMPGLGDRIASLSQPFEPADVAAILRRLGVI